MKWLSLVLGLLWIVALIFAGIIAVIILFVPSLKLLAAYFILMLIPIAFFILQRLVPDRDNRWLFAFCFACYLFVMIPFAPILSARVMGNYFKSPGMTVFLLTSLLFIIPTTFRGLKFFFDHYGVRYPPDYYENIEDEDMFKENSSSLVKQFVSSAFLRLLLLLGISMADYLLIRVPYIKDIYAGIILSVTYDAFYRPFAQTLKKRKIASIRKEG